MVSLSIGSRLKDKRILLGTALAFVFICIVSSYFYLHKKHKHNTDGIIDENILLDNNQKLRVMHAIDPEKGLLLYITNQPQAKKATEYAKQFASLSYYVALVDNEALLNAPTNGAGQCLNIAKKLNRLNTQLKSHYNIDNDELPILVATEDSSATLYAALAQAEEHKFHAAVSINFDPQLKSHANLCKQQSFSTLDNQQLKLVGVKRVPTSFYIFQDQNISPDATQFAENVGNVKLTFSDNKKQNAQAEAIQILQWLDPRLADQISSDSSDSNLPIIEVPAVEQQNPDNQIDSDSIAVILTGDGGWAEIDKNIAKILSEKGIPAVALDSLSYFWKVRTPEETAKDVETIIEQYLEKWNKKNVILIGYSFGADVLPFVANNLSADTQHKISLVALLGMGKTAAFEFRLSSWMNADTNASRLPLIPEITKMKWANSICIYGVNDEAANCLPAAELGVKVISMTGDHHFDEKYDELVQHIIENEKPK